MFLDGLQDIHFAARAFRRTPSFTAVAVLTLALGIGANTALFSVVNALLLRPLPYAHPERLVQLYENVPAAESSTRKPMRLGGLNAGEWIEIRDHANSFARVSSISQSLVTLLDAGDTAFVNGASMTPGTAAMLGVPPVLGRWFTDDEERAGSHVLVVSDAMWQRYFGARRDALGATVRFTGTSLFVGAVALGTPYTIVGVMPRGFHFPDDRNEFWMPAPASPAPDPRRRIAMFAELRKGVTAAAATAELTAIVRGVRGRSAPPPSFEPARFELVPLRDAVAPSVRSALLVLTGAVGFVLLIASTNVANLLIARTASREREIAIRVAVGAGRGRIVRQLITESLVLALAGGAAGTALAYGGVRMFRVLATTMSRFDLGDTVVFPRIADIAIDAPVLAFAAAVSMATGVLFGVVPAVRAVRFQQLSAYRRSRLYHVLLAAEIALALPLVVGGGLLVRSFVNLVTLDPGYDPRNALTFQVAARGDRYSADQMEQLASGVAARIAAMPDVAAVGYARQLPMVRLEETHSFRRKPDIPPPGPAPDGADARYISPGYLQAIGARLVAGRWPAAPNEVIVNRRLARREFGSESPVGGIVYIGRNATPRTVTGVVDDARLYGLDKDPPAQFFANLSLWDGPARFRYPVGPYFVVRTRSDPQRVLPAIAAAVRLMDPEAPLYNVASLDRILSHEVTLPRIYSVLVGVFASLAIALAAVGIYGVMAYAVVQRTREIGIRMALGARRGQVLWLVLGRSALHASAGLAIGLAGAAMLTRYLESLLFGLRPLDPLTFAAAAALFAVVALVAAYVPARQATAVDPLVALRTE